MINDLNNVQIEGTLDRDPELSATANSGTPVANMHITNRRFYNVDGEERTENSTFVVQSWGKLATICHKLGKKGGFVRIVGRLKQNAWVSKEGDERSRTEIIATTIDFN